MSTLIGRTLPDRVLSLFDGERTDTKIGRAYLLVTTDPDQQPRPCMLSAGEILATGPHALRLAVWAHSHTSANLAAASPLVLCLVDHAGVLYVRGHPRRLAVARNATLQLDCFEIEVTAVESDAHDGLPVRHGIAYSTLGLPRDALLATWRAQLRILRDAKDPAKYAGDGGTS